MGVWRLRAGFLGSVVEVGVWIGEGGDEVDGEMR